VEARKWKLELNKTSHKKTATSNRITGGGHMFPPEQNSAEDGC